MVFAEALTMGCFTGTGFDSLMLLTATWECCERSSELGQLGMSLFQNELGTSMLKKIDDHSSLASEINEQQGSP